MAKKEVDPLDEFLDKRHRYRVKSRKEGLAIVAACWAAAKISDSPVYRRHFALQTKAVINGDFIPLEIMKEAMKVNTIIEVLAAFPFPEDTCFSQRFCVDFGVTCRSRHEYVAVELTGRLEKRRIEWKVTSVTAPYHWGLLTEDELRRLS